MDGARRENRAVSCHGVCCLVEWVTKTVPVSGIRHLLAR